MRLRLERLRARLAIVGSCPVCNDRGVPGIRIEYIGPGEQPDSAAAPGCMRCGKIGEVTVLILDSTPLGNTPLPGEPGAQYADIDPLDSEAVPGHQVN